MTTLTEALQQAFLAGFSISGEGYNAEYPFQDSAAPVEQDLSWIQQRDYCVQKIISNLSLERMAENARELGLDYGVDPKETHE